MADDEIASIREAFERCREAEQDNRERGLADLRFARMGEQWPENIRKARETAGKPCLTINKMPSFIRTVVNDARQNKPEIKTRPVDDGADVETAKVINGLIKQIEVSSSADIAYDTAVEGGVSNGFGYITVDTEYAYDDAFEQDIRIKRVADPFVIYGDANSTAADGSDWNEAFEIALMTKEEFDSKWKGKAHVNWDDDVWNKVGAPWRDGETVMVANYWKREEVEKGIVLCDTPDGRHTYDADALETDEDLVFGVEQGLIREIKRRTTRAYKVTRKIVSGAEVLETQDWPGCYIPIVPVYGDEFFVEGKRILLSLVNPAKDAATAFNVMRSTSVELFGLQPKVPFIGKKGAFDADENWQTANTESHPFLEYEGEQPPQRQPLDMGPAAGAMQEALAAADDMKDIMGVHDASLGLRSNETSGKAIMARQREGDVSTFHFIDNMARSIRHVGRIIIDLIPHIYNTERIVRVMGDDGTERAVQINQQYPKQDQNGQPVMQQVPGPDGNPVMQPVYAIHDLTQGKYDLVVDTGPSFTTRREESSQMMTEFMRAYPPAAPMIIDLVAKNQDWPGADVIAERLKHMVPQQAEGGLPPEVQQQMGEMKQALDQASQKVQELEQSTAADMAAIESKEKIAFAEIASKEKIAEAQRMSQRRTEMAANDLVEVPDENGQATVQNATVQAVNQMGQTLAGMLVQQSQALASIAQLLAAPTEIQIGPNGQKRAVKVPAMVN